ncbi:MAG: hypothetical protein ACYC9Z_18435, partial [Casimicrobiaceae bacterium]
SAAPHLRARRTNHRVVRNRTPEILACVCHTWILSQTAGRNFRLDKVKSYRPVANDRIKKISQFKVQGMGTEPTGIDLLEPSQKTVHRIYMLAALGLASRRMDPGQSQVAPAGKNIAAILVSRSGALLAVGLKRSQSIGMAVTAMRRFEPRLNTSSPFLRARGVMLE